jgi:hypothetical protein
MFFILSLLLLSSKRFQLMTPILKAGRRLRLALSLFIVFIYYSSTYVLPLSLVSCLDHALPLLEAWAHCAARPAHSSAQVPEPILWLELTSQADLNGVS